MCINMNRVMAMVALLLCVGLMLFLGGLKMMSSGLERLCRSSFAQAVRHCTGSRWAAFLTGVLFTAITQSSSLATVIVVGMVEAGILGLGAAIAVIIGANVGTTVTGQLLSFHLFDYAGWLVAAGVLLWLLPGKEQREAGRTLLGLGVLLYGLETMGGALAPLAETPWAAAFLQAAALHPAAGILAGATVTALVQSSSAVVGMAIALAQEEALTLAAGAGILVGADVGTCVTSLLAALGLGTAARRAAAAHLLFNVISVALILPLFPLYIQAAAASGDTVARQLANAHTLYNFGGAVVLMALLTPFQRLIEALVTAENSEKKRIFARFGEILEKWF